MIKVEKGSAASVCPIMTVMRESSMPTREKNISNATPIIKLGRTIGSNMNHCNRVLPTNLWRTNAKAAIVPPTVAKIAVPDASKKLVLMALRAAGVAKNS
jgi:hypothetical protein